jgi:hypothetical protein
MGFYAGGPPVGFGARRLRTVRRRLGVAVRRIDVLRASGREEPWSGAPARGFAAAARQRAGGVERCFAGRAGGRHACHARRVHFCVCSRGRQRFGWLAGRFDALGRRSRVRGARAVAGGRAFATGRL